MVSITFRPAAVGIATAVGIAAAAVAIAVWGVPSWVAALVALWCASVSVITWHGSTLAGWVTRVRQRSQPLRGVRMVEHEGAATMHGSREVTAWVEVDAPEPFAVTVVDVDGDVSRPSLSPARLSRLLEQDDIVLSSMDFITISQRSAYQSRMSSAISQIMGKVSHPVDGRSFIRVSMDVPSSHAAVAARAIGGSMEGGASGAIVAAAARVSVQVQAAGYTARVLTPEQAERISLELASLSEPETVSWSRITSQAGLVTEMVTAHPRESQQETWLALPAVKTLTQLRLGFDERGAVRAGYTAGFVTTPESSVITALRGLPVRVLGGQQTQALSNYIPLAQGRDVAMMSEAISSDWEGVPVFGGGVGTLLGQMEDGSRLFMRTRPASGATAQVVGSEQVAAWVLMRLAQQEMSIDVRLEGEQWRAVVEAIGSPLVTYRSSPLADVVVTTPGDRVRGRATVIEVSETLPSLPAPVAIVASSGSEVTVTTPEGAWTLPWTITASEAEALALL